MAGGDLTQVFVPRIFETPDARGVVVGRPMQEGEYVDAREPILRVQSRGVDGAILAPAGGEIVRLHVAEGDAVFAGSLVAELRLGAPKPESESPRSVESRQLAPQGAARARAAVAAALAATGLAWPVFTLALLAVAAGALAAMKLAAQPSGRAGSALSLFAAGVVRLVWFALLAALAAGLLGGMAWLLTDGIAGVPAAARIAAFELGPRVLAFALVFRLVRAWLESSPQAEQLRALAAGLSLAAAGLGAAVILLWLSVCAFVLPHGTWSPAGSFQAATAVLGDDATRSVRDAQVDWVRYEVSSVQDCLVEKRRGGWNYPDVEHREDSGSIVVSVYAADRASPGPQSVAALVLALQNQLEPHRVVVAIHPRDGELVYFRTRASVRPRTSVADVLGNDVTGAAAEAISAAQDRDVRFALECSAVAF